jgi:hypothetical protein
MSDRTFTTQPVAATWGVDPEFCDLRALELRFGIKRSAAYGIIARGEIRSVVLRRPGTIKGRRLVEVASVRNFLSRQPTDIDPRLSELNRKAQRASLPISSTAWMTRPIDSVQGARHDVLLCRVDCSGEGFHPIRPRTRQRRPPPRCLHHFVSHPAKEDGIGPLEVLDRVTKQVFVREHCTMIAAPVQCDVDGVPKGSHYVRVPIAIGRPNEKEISHGRVSWQTH